MNTKQQIVEISADFLREHGFNGFSYLDLSRALGISKASVHHHYPKKDDLGLALCEWTHDWLIQGLEHFDTKGHSSWNKLERYLQAAMKHTLTDHKMCPISALYSDLNKLSEPMRIALKALDDIELDWVTKVMREGTQGGEFIKQDDAKAMAALFIFSCKGALYYARLHGQDLFHQTMTQFEQILRQTGEHYAY
jgi:TetR/AcrR family transcriptional repressor of nem operon